MRDIERDRHCTIDDVAALAGVSTATISRVLNGTAKVAPETAQRVEQAVSALGFVPRAAARTLAGGKTNILGLLVPEISGDFFVPMLRGIEKAAGDLGYDLLIQTTAYRHKDFSKRISGDPNTDGLLLFTDSVDDAAILMLESSKTPAVLLYREPPPGSRFPSVTIENEKGAFTAVSHLIGVHARKRIVFMAGPPGNHDGLERERGYRAALAAHGLAFSPELVCLGGFSTKTAQASLAALIQQGVPFDGVFAADDGSAFGVLSALRAASRRVPRDVSVMGFDDVPTAAYTLPSLSTVRAPTERVGASAVHLLVQRIAGESGPASLVLPTELVTRRSCGCMEEKEPKRGPTRPGCCFRRSRRLGQGGRG